MERSVHNNAKTALAIFFWGWPVIYSLFVVVDSVILAGVPAGTGYNHLPLSVAFTVAGLSIITIVLIVSVGAAMKHIPGMAIFTTLAHYVFLCLLYIILAFPCYILLFKMVGGEFITASGADAWPALLLFYISPLAIWLPTSGRAVWKLLLRASGVESGEVEK